MREISINEIAGIWRYNEEHYCIDLNIRPDAISRFTKTNLSNNSAISETQGKCKLVVNENGFSNSIWIGNDLELVIWELDLENQDLILEISDIGRYRFNKIS